MTVLVTTPRTYVSVVAQTWEWDGTSWSARAPLWLLPLVLMAELARSQATGYGITGNTSMPYWHDDEEVDHDLPRG